MDTSDKQNWIHAKYAHIRIPKALLNVKLFPQLSPEAILLYGAMVDRTSLSICFGKKCFVSPSNEVTIIFTQKEIMQLLRCKRDKARAVTQELVNSKLISVMRKKKHGPYIITVIPKIWADFDHKKQNVGAHIPMPMSEKSSFDDDKTHISRNENTALNNTILNNTVFNNTSAQRNCINAILSDYKHLAANYETAHIIRILDVLEELFSSTPNTLRIHGRELDWKTIVAAFSELSIIDIEFVLNKMKKAQYTSEFSDAFILDALYTAVYMLN